MKKPTIFFLSAIIIVFVLLFQFTSAKDTISESAVSFYEVPLVCGAAPEIGCGSRVKPLFLETAKHPGIEEAWINRQGTAIAFVWSNKTPDEKLSEALFQQFNIEAKLISDLSKQKDFLASFDGKDKWYKGNEVDQLSIEEAGIIAKTTINVILKADLLNETEAGVIQSDIEEYFKAELVKVRSYDELKSEETVEKWKLDAFQIFTNHVGKERAEKIAEFMGEKENCKEPNEKSCCDKTSNKDCCKKKK